VTDTEIIEGLTRIAETARLTEAEVDCVVAAARAIQAKGARKDRVVGLLLELKAAVHGL
jgi:hypothetical protein